MYTSTVIVTKILTHWILLSCRCWGCLRGRCHWQASRLESYRPHSLQTHHSEAPVVHLGGRTHPYIEERFHNYTACPIKRGLMRYLDEFLFGQTLVQLSLEIHLQKLQNILRLKILLHKKKKKNFFLLHNYFVPGNPSTSSRHRDPRTVRETKRSPANIMQRKTNRLVS